MKRQLITALTLAQLIFPFAAEAQRSTTSMTRTTIDNSEKTGQIGVGLQAGSFTGVGADYWLNEANVINGTVASEHDNFAISLNHQWMFRNAFSAITQRREGGSLVPYIGAGALAILGSHSDFLKRNTENAALAAQVPVGLEFLPNRERFSVYAEVAPSYEIAPVAFGFLTADLGAKFFF